ncbi:hypothetical protein B0H13DRAFT_2339942 [Mycena leptocephala]|nr:hypothetical protein B0H13DRAFT_2339942 [Mycena leptocephala]
MSCSSTLPTNADLYGRRRRAHIACTNCRRRKIKCIKLSDDDDYGPCAMCAPKGLPCEYAPVPKDSQPGMHPKIALHLHPATLGPTNPEVVDVVKHDDISHEEVPEAW